MSGSRSRATVNEPPAGFRDSPSTRPHESGGKRAPEFAVQSTNGDEVTLHDGEGKTVVKLDGERGDIYLEGVGWPKDAP